jgi:hypothetical protein
MYNHDLEQEFKDFNTTVALLLKALKLQDKDLVNTHKQTLSSLIGCEEATRVLNAAVSQLIHTCPEICDWTTHNFPELQVCKDLQEHLCLFAVQKLINNGFTLGKDFSTKTNSMVLVCQNIKVSLMLLCSRAEWKLIKSVVQVVDSRETAV